MADISKIKTPDGTTYNIKDATARSQSGVTGVKGNAESSYRTGNVNLTSANIGAIPSNTAGNTQNLSRPTGLRGLNDVTLQPLINTTRANRLAFLPADQIIIEKTTDGGTTWVDAGVSDATKVGLFSETRVGVNIPLLNGVRSTLCGLRVTISAMKYNVPSGTAETQKYNYWSATYVSSQERYCQLKEFYFWLSASNDSIGIKIERATGANPNSWSTTFNDSAFYMTGWSGCDYVKLDWQSTFGGGTNQTGNHWNYRLTFMTRGVNGTDTMGTGYETQSQSIMEIRGYGDTWWGRPNEYMANDKLYTHDYLQNVTFPNKVTATGGFSGTLTGNVTGTASKATADASGNTITSYYAPKSTAVTNVALATNKITKTINGATTDVVTAATTSVYGITKLSTSTSSTATDLAATPSAVRAAYNLANGANTTANTALSGVNGTLIYDHTYSITNGVATFVPHVYLKGEEVTSNYAASCFTWKYRLSSTSSGTPSYVNLTTDSTTKGCTVAITTLGYGGYVLGTFTPPAS